MPEGPGRRQPPRCLRLQRGEIERIAQVGFQRRPAPLASVDKANVLETSRLWREVVRVRRGVPGVALEHLLVDDAAMEFVAAEPST